MLILVPISLESTSREKVCCAQTMHVMAGFRPFLNILKTYNSDNFHGELHTIASNICQAIFVGFILAMELLTTILLLWRWIDDNFSLYSLAISTGIVGVQVAASNISMMANNRTITRTFDYIEMAIRSRNF